MSIALAVTLAVYAVYAPLMAWFLWRLTWPGHKQRVRVPGVLGNGKLVITSDSDYVGLI